MSKSHVDKHFRNGCYWLKHTFLSLEHVGKHETPQVLLGLIFTVSVADMFESRSFCTLWKIEHQDIVHLAMANIRLSCFKTPRFYVHMTVFWLFVLLIRIVDTRNGRTLFIIQNCSFEVIPLCALVARRSTPLQLTLQDIFATTYYINGAHSINVWENCHGNVNCITRPFCPRYFALNYALFASSFIGCCGSRFSFCFVCWLVSMLSKDHEVT